MNAAYENLKEMGHIAAIEEYAKDTGVGEVEVIFSYSRFDYLVSAEVVSLKTGRIAHRAEQLSEFEKRGDKQDELALSMLMACVDELAQGDEEWTNDQFFKSFPSLDPNNHKQIQQSSKKNFFAWADEAIPSETAVYRKAEKKTFATIPSPEAAKRPKRKILD